MILRPQLSLLHLDDFQRPWPQHVWILSGTPSPLSHPSRGLGFKSFAEQNICLAFSKIRRKHDYLIIILLFLVLVSYYFGEKKDVENRKITVHRCPDYLFNIWPFSTLEISLITLRFCQSRLKFCKH